MHVREADFQEYAAVHQADYLAKLQQMATGTLPEILPKLSIECTGLEFCLPGYSFSLGGLFEAVDQIKAGRFQRAYCFSLGSHHAHADWGHGYCILNPLAACARYAQSKGFGHILIVDWDIHHGDGTQSIFRKDKSIYQISVHSLADLYMSLAGGMRNATTSAAEAAGHCNIPILHNDYDDNFLQEMGLPGKFYRGRDSLSALYTALHELPWEPDMVLIHSGYDGHQDDCGRHITDWGTEDFGTMTHSVVEIANSSHCPVVSLHGGGYNRQTTIEAAKCHVAYLAETN